MGHESASGARGSWSTSATWLDYDRDGKLDLFVANYVQWTAKGDLWCSLDGATKSYCTPESYKGTQSKLFHNLGNGRFEDASAKAGLGDPTSKSLGVTVFDFNGDGWPDIFVANDTQPNKLYKNNGNGTFSEGGMAAGVAFGEDGVARGAMGTDAGDYDRSGRPHLLVGNGGTTGRAGGRSGRARRRRRAGAPCYACASPVGVVITRPVTSVADR